MPDLIALKVDVEGMMKRADRDGHVMDSKTLREIHSVLSFLQQPQGNDEIAKKLKNLKDNSYYVIDDHIIFADAIKALTYPQEV